MVSTCVASTFTNATLSQSTPTDDSTSVMARRTVTVTVQPHQVCCTCASLVRTSRSLLIPPSDCDAPAQVLFHRKLLHAFHDTPPCHTWCTSDRWASKSLEGNGGGPISKHPSLVQHTQKHVPVVPITQMSNSRDPV